MGKQLLILLIISISFFSKKTSAQDIHFSQFWDPLSVTSPTLIGNFDGDIKAHLHYRNQWSQFNSPLATVYADITYKKLSKSGDYWAMGLSVLNDQMNYLTYRQLRMYLSFSYQKRFSKTIQAGAGLQFGFRNTSLDYTTLTFDKQWDFNTGTFSNSLPSYENFSIRNQYTGFFNIGGSINIIKEKSLNTIDASAMYIGQNESSAQDYVFYQPFKFAINYHSYWLVGKKWTLMPKLGAIFTARTNLINTGLLAKITFDNKKEMYFGPLFRWGIDRNSDAVIPVIGFKINGLKIGFSYDATISGLNQEGLKNAYELSLTYIVKFQKNQYYSIDCMRL